METHPVEGEAEEDQGAGAGASFESEGGTTLRAPTADAAETYLLPPQPEGGESGFGRRGELRLEKDDEEPEPGLQRETPEGEPGGRLERLDDEGTPEEALGGPGGSGGERPPAPPAEEPAPEEPEDEGWEAIRREVADLVREIFIQGSAGANGPTFEVIRELLQRSPEESGDGEEANEEELPPARPEERLDEAVGSNVESPAPDAADTERAEPEEPSSAEAVEGDRAPETTEVQGEAAAEEAAAGRQADPTSGGEADEVVRLKGAEAAGTEASPEAAPSVVGPTQERLADYGKTDQGFLARVEEAVTIGELSETREAEATALRVSIVADVVTAISTWETAMAIQPQGPQEIYYPGPQVIDEALELFAQPDVQSRLADNHTRAKLGGAPGTQQTVEELFRTIEGTLNGGLPRGLALRVVAASEALKERGGPGDVKQALYLRRQALEAQWVSPEALRTWAAGRRVHPSNPWPVAAEVSTEPREPQFIENVLRELLGEVPRDEK